MAQAKRADKACGELNTEDAQDRIPAWDDVDGTAWYKSQMRANIMHNSFSDDIGYSVLSDREGLTNNSKINALIRAYQRSREPQEKREILWGNNRRKGLIWSFLPLLKSYTAILATCRAAEDDKHGQWLVKYIRPFYNRYPYIHTLIMDMAQSIDNDESNELLHEMMIAFEQCLEWWMPTKNKHGVTMDFVPYIHVHFKFYVQRWFEEFINKQGIIASESDDIADYLGLPDEDDNIDLSAQAGGGDNTNQLSVSWYLGDTCHEAFKPLSPVQRKVLVWRHLANLPDKELAARLYMSVDTVQAMIQEAEQIVRQYEEQKT